MEGPHKDKHESVCVGHCHAFPADTADGTMKKKKSTMRISLQPLAHKQDNHTFHALYHTELKHGMRHCWYVPQIDTSFNRTEITFPPSISYTVHETDNCVSEILLHLWGPAILQRASPPSSFRKSPQHHLYFTVSVFLIRFRFTDCLLLESRVVFWEILLPHCWSECKTSQVL